MEYINNDQIKARIYLGISDFIGYYDIGYKGLITLNTEVIKKAMVE
jgi:hypothetical protein